MSALFGIRTAAGDSVPKNAAGIRIGNGDAPSPPGWRSMAWRATSAITGPHPGISAGASFRPIKVVRSIRMSTVPRVVAALPVWRPSNRSR